MLSVIKSNPLTLINQLFDWNLESDDEKKKSQLNELIPAMFATSKYYIIAAKGTTEKDWNSKEFAAFVNEKKDLLVFIDGNDATRFAKQNGLICAADSSPMIKCISYSALAKLVVNYDKIKMISRVKVFARRPLFLFCPVSYFQQNMEQKNLDLMNSKFEADDEILYPDRTFAMVEDIKKVLDMPEASKRRAIDPGLICQNLHTVIEKLIYFNHLEMTDLEHDLKLPPGWLHHFCADRVSSNVSKMTTLKLLRYFGLQEYLYQYKRYCTELMSELNRDETIDIYEIKPVNLKTEEKFKLMGIRRGHDSRNNAFVYELSLRSKNRDIQLTVSTPLNYIVGKSYEIVGLDANDKMDDDPPMLKSEKKEAPKKKEKPHDNEVVMNTGSIERPYQNAHRSNRTKTQFELDHDTIIGYFKREEHDTLMAAENKLRKIARHDEILHAFAVYVDTKRPYSSVNVQGFTVGKLMQEYQYDAFEAHCILAALKDKPSETKHKLDLRRGELKAQRQQREAAKNG